MKSKAKIYIRDNKLNIEVFFCEYLTLSKAKESLEINGYKRVKNIKDKPISIEIDNQKMNVLDYINSVNDNNQKSKNKIMYKNTNNIRYIAILEF